MEAQSNVSCRPHVWRLAVGGKVSAVLVFVVLIILAFEMNSVLEPTDRSFEKDRWREGIDE